ncbi:hypothetical protein [Bauldia litoralis]|uniref:Uncharacterized protein n=1 Tax=Bauldia litoralis TaxID=665467 RepID=A0A1G6DU28_9HYPH|nr:hypothetical protein [Bauldia litoralis]SDB48673.1 hypothetical protein SAMN02982931_03777 [Bauldia litoralis]
MTKRDPKTIRKGMHMHGAERPASMGADGGIIAKEFGNAHKMQRELAEQAEALELRALMGEKPIQMSPEFSGRTH